MRKCSGKDTCRGTFVRLKIPERFPVPEFFLLMNFRFFLFHRLSGIHLQMIEPVAAHLCGIDHIGERTWIHFFHQTQQLRHAVFLHHGHQHLLAFLGVAAGGLDLGDAAPLLRNQRCGNLIAVGSDDVNNLRKIHALRDNVHHTTADEQSDE